jgi:hypothetical protein
METLDASGSHLPDATGKWVASAGCDLGTIRVIRTVNFNEVTLGKSDPPKQFAANC